MLPNPVTLDRAHLVRQTGGDQELERELLALFDDQCAALVPVVSDGTPSEQAGASHALKGAALAIGAFRVARAADRIEATIDREAGLATDEMVQALRIAVAELRCELKRIDGEG